MSVYTEEMYKKQTHIRSFFIYLQRKIKINSL